MEEQAINPYAAPKARVDDDPNVGEAPPLWGPEAAGALSLLLSVSFGSWIVWQNWKALGEGERAASAAKWFYFSIAMVAILLVVPFAGLLGIIFLISWYIAQNKPQIKYVKERFGKNYPRRRWSKPVWTALGILLPSSIVLGFLSAFLFGA